MHLFRRSLDISRAMPREATPADLTGVSRLFHSSGRRFLGFPGDDLPALLSSAPAMLLVAGNEIWAAAIGGWRAQTTTWLRGLALNDGLLAGAGLDALLPPFHALLRSQGIQRLFYAGDEAADTWLQPALRSRGYQGDTKVIVYEKRGLDVPAPGNQAVRVRQGQPVDLPAVLAVDRACFAPQWNKDEGILGPALLEAPYCVVAEIDGQAVGYAFATTHFGDRLIHLVRIAVLPDRQGQGIGVRLLNEVVDFARVRGAETLTLNTQVDNTGAQRLYEWFGFRRTGEQQVVLRYDL